MFLRGQLGHCGHWVGCVIVNVLMFSALGYFVSVQALGQKFGFGGIWVVFVSTRVQGGQKNAL